MKSLRERAMDYLSRREHSRDELCRKLIAKDADLNEARLVIDELAAEGLQSDLRFTENYVRHRANAGFGPRRISLELEERGVAEPLIEKFVWQDAQDWLCLLEAAWARKFDQFETFGTKAYAAQQRFLTQRGFDPEDIHHVLQRRVD